MMVKMGYLTVQNDDLTRKCGKMMAMYGMSYRNATSKSLGTLNMNPTVDTAAPYSINNTLSFFDRIDGAVFSDNSTNRDSRHAF
jgi:hypothetical protein